MPRCLPALVLNVLGLHFGALFVNIGRILGPRRPNAAKVGAYESGMPSDFAVRRIRVGVSCVHGLMVGGIFLGLLGVAFVYEWARVALDPRL